MLHSIFTYWKLRIISIQSHDFHYTLHCSPSPFAFVFASPKQKHICLVQCGVKGIGKLQRLLDVTTWYMTQKSYRESIITANWFQISTHFRTKFSLFYISFVFVTFAVFDLQVIWDIISSRCMYQKWTITSTCQTRRQIKLNFQVLIQVRSSKNDCAKQPIAVDLVSTWMNETNTSEIWLVWARNHHRSFWMLHLTIVVT